MPRTSLLLPPDLRSEAFAEDLIEPALPLHEPARPGSRALIATLAALLLLALLALPSAPALAG